MSILRVSAVAGRSLDHSLGRVGAATLTRRADGLFVEVGHDDVASLVRALAFAGVQAVPAAVDLSTPRGPIPALGLDLASVPSALVAADVVRVRAIPLGEATAEVLRRRLGWLRGPSERARIRCRTLLRGEDVLLAWDRRAWIDRRDLRDRRLRAHLRPVVFDRGALDAAPARRIFASDGLLAGWLFA